LLGPAAVSRHLSRRSLQESSDRLNYRLAKEHNDGSLVRMWKCVDHPNQLWEIADLPDGHYRLKNKE